MPCLIDVRGKRIPLRRGQTYVMGRGESSDVIVEDLSCSRSHAQITVAVATDAAFLEDLGSRNGSYLNGELVRGRVGLPERARIRLGSSVFLVELKDSRQEINLAETGTIGFEAGTGGVDLDGGELGTLGLGELLKLLLPTRRNVTMSAALPDVYATVEVRDGEVVAASFGDLEGFNALVKLGRASSGIYWTVENTEPCERNVHEPSAKLLLELSRCLDPAAR